jgi:molecular chaperone GrpE|tara:strand:- start:41 stop:616 length:576 start_codon:yes stop_codon:yes gene_type:complete
MENEKKVNDPEKIEEKDEVNLSPTLEEKLRESEDKLLRALAEIENQRRRFEKETKEAFEFGGFNFAKETLTLLDNLQRAKISIKNDNALKDNEGLDKFIKNIEIIEDDMISTFQKNNIKKIQCLKEKFDPNLHQAMLEVEDEHSDAGIIVQEIQAGYMYGDRLLRPSFVGVSKKKTQKNDEKSEKIETKDL